MIKPRRKRTIPEIRDRLYVLANRFGIPELRQLARETVRRSFGVKARAQQAKLTPALVKKVRLFVARNPKLSQREVGRQFQIDGGRVNEILHGFRDGRYYTKAGILRRKK